MKRMTCLLAVLVLLVLTACQSQSSTYGVFIGLNRDDISRLNNYETVVVEPNEFSRKEVQSLQDKGKTVFAYLNIGTIETFRSYYDSFKDITLDNYEDWPDEYWIDVSQEKWQDYCIGLAEKIKEKGFDGFFVDNLDVYHYYPKSGIYDGICSILRQLKAMDTEVIINGAKEFVTTTFTMDGDEDLFDAVNQEEVFTRIDFDNETYHNQKVKETAILKKYLKAVKKEGYRVYLLEYSPGKATLKRIQDYCEKNGFEYYCAPSLKLE